MTSNDMARAADSSAVRDYVAISEATYAGEYFDSASDRWIFMFIADPGTHLADLKDRFAYPDRLDVRLAKHSMKDLLTWAQQVGADTRRWRDHGVWVSQVGPDVESNSVTLYVRPMTDTQRRHLLDAYSNTPVRVVEDGGGFAAAWSSPTQRPR